MSKNFFQRYSINSYFNLCLSLHERASQSSEFEALFKVIIESIIYSGTCLLLMMGAKVPKCFKKSYAN